MKFTMEEEQQIDKAAEFLVQKGYQKTYWNDLIVYKKGQVQFYMIHKEWFSKYDININFEVKDKNFFILSEIAYARKGLKLLEDEHFEDILRLLQYLQENYDNLTNIEYCRESDKMVDKLLEDAVDKAADFLLKRGYKKKCWDNEMEYENERIKFSMTLRKNYRDAPNIWIKFKKEDEVFFAKTLVLARKEIEMPKNVEDIYVILALLRYIREDYDNIANIEYCRESKKLELEYLRRLSEEKIDKAAYFLVEKGYQKVKTEDSIVYKKGNVEFTIYTEFEILKTQSYKRLDDIDIRFVAENESYHVWMIADVRKHVQKSYSFSEWFKDGAKLLCYIQEDYDNLMDIEYCRGSLRIKKEADKKAREVF